ncbi:MULTISPECIES: helix-turn-helix domain-containing protein [Legionella]|uniref:Putative transcriptional regulator, XRE family n=1 Tax=Legionella maceachernii TaxID=466 RepID=A0A0W0WBG9_9GAMM|nr:XRE family transcriptional regulator [Legionella maceachernii]KTD29334.1 putative transcriptional regulator, XRE family [Legionella maceachernii]SKA31384.1 Helix-turn-helix domain-containing protein [Legionella maceachernii]SUP03219.1 Antitoxin HigA [Legionella maceachernii]
MAKPLSKLTEKISKEVDTAATAKAAEMLAEMDLDELRKVCHITQNQVAEVLQITQPSVAQLEKRDDIYISTLRNYLFALGAKLELVACFPDGRKVSLSGFTYLNSSK